MAVACVLVAIVPTRFAIWVTRRHCWYRLREQQWAEINKLRQLISFDGDDRPWQNTVTTLYNVWGNTLYVLESATEEEMRALLRRLSDLVSSTDTQSRIPCVLAMYDILLERDPQSDFIRGYRDAVR